MLFLALPPNPLLSPLAGKVLLNLLQSLKQGMAFYILVLVLVLVLPSSTSTSLDFIFLPSTSTSSLRLQLPPFDSNFLPSTSLIITPPPPPPSPLQSLLPCLRGLGFFVVQIT